MTLTPEQITSLLKEMMERIDNPLPHMRPFQVELKDPMPREMRTKGAGLTRKATFDVDADLYGHLQNTIPEQAVLRGILWLEEIIETESSSDKKEKKTKKKSGPYGKFWEEMFLEQVIGNSEFKTYFNVSDGLDSWNERVREVFGRESLTEVSPDDVCAWLAGLPVKETPTDLIDKIRKVAKSLEPEFPEGQFFSPFDLGAKKPTKPELSDEQYLADNQMP